MAIIIETVDLHAHQNDEKTKKKQKKRAKKKRNQGEAIQNSVCELNAKPMIERANLYELDSVPCLAIQNRLFRN